MSITDDQFASLEKTPLFGAVQLNELRPYIITIKQRKKDVNDNWVSVDGPYLPVDGKVLWASLDHARQGKKLDILPAKIINSDGDSITLEVTVVSEIYGTRSGIATSKFEATNQSEKQFPWEVAQTSAIGRALENMGYGIFPVPDVPTGRSTSRPAARAAAPDERNKATTPTTPTTPAANTTNDKVTTATNVTTTQNTATTAAKSKFGGNGGEPLILNANFKIDAGDRQRWLDFLSRCIEEGVAGSKMNDGGASIAELLTNRKIYKFAPAKTDEYLKDLPKGAWDN